MLHQLRAIGVRIALDDFGTGYSSLSYLQRFPFDKIKIDRCFINDIAEPDGSSSIVQAVVNIAAERHMTTTAEGVETEQQQRAAARARLLRKCRAICSARRSRRRRSGRCWWRSATAATRRSRASRAGESRWRGRRSAYRTAMSRSANPKLNAAQGIERSERALVVCKTFRTFIIKARQVVRAVHARLGPNLSKAFLQKRCSFAEVRDCYRIGIDFPVKRSGHPAFPRERPA